MIRAVKYAAATGFSLPFYVKMKIHNQSGLLTSISHSRLTEEIQKIIHSSQAAAIVDMLDKTGLYSYLQPSAAMLMKKNPNFRQRYLKSLAALNGNENFQGQSLGALFYDYLEDTSDWKPGTIENFKEIYKTARTFILPMNPPRFEMQYALKKFLTSHGITIKRTSLHGKPAVESGETAVKSKRRRRHKPTGKYPIQ
jgi:poly(A) polymerase